MHFTVIVQRTDLCLCVFQYLSMVGRRMRQKHGYTPDKAITDVALRQASIICRAHETFPIKSPNDAFGL
jgi:hypothetical protein